MLLSKKLFLSFFPQFTKTSIDDLCKMLNSIGIEIENIHTFEKIKGLIVGKILGVEKHPKSSKLNLCKVFFEKKEHLIVCGANNVKANQKVIVAKINTKMLDGAVIKNRNILGIESNGMICSYSELTNRCDFLPNSEKDNIVVLDSFAKINDDNPLKYIGLDDVIFDLSIPSNRNELNGILSIGYDLLPILDDKNVFDFSINLDHVKTSNIEIKNSSSNFYGFIEVENWKIEESSWKTKYFLMNSGIIPVCPIVDISNLNMIISGNPSHSFSFDSIIKEIQITDNMTGKFVGLNNVEYKIENKDICIISNQKIIALAGIIGGIESFITNTYNKKILFEIANFDHLLIKRTSDRLQLKTPAAFIFSKKIPLWISFKSLEIFVTLLESLDCKIVGINYTKLTTKRNKINFDYLHITKLLGIKISEKEITQTLKSFGFIFFDNNKYIMPPIYREDIENSHDVVEEILKKININNLPTKMIGDSFVNLEFNYEYKNYLYLKNFFLSKGFAQLRTYNLTSINKNRLFNIFNQKNNVEIVNPISIDKIVLRNNILEKHLDVLQKNISYKNKLFPTFEIQKLLINNINNYYLSCVIPTNIFSNILDGSKINNNILLLKSFINDLFINYGVLFSFEENNLNFSFIRKNNSLLIFSNEKMIGVIGELELKICKEYDFKNKVFFMEINVHQLLMSKGHEFTIYEITNKHPIKRTLSIITSKTNFKKLENVINQINYIDSYEVKDLYQYEDKKVSYNIEFTFSFKINNPSNEDISSVFNSLIYILENNDFQIRKTN